MKWTRNPRKVKICVTMHTQFIESVLQSLALMPQMVRNVPMTDGEPNYPDAMPPSALKLTTSHGIQSKEGGREA